MEFRSSSSRGSGSAGAAGGGARGGGDGDGNAAEEGRYFSLANDGRRRKKRKLNWSDDDTMCLIGTWKEHLRALRSTKRNLHVYEEMAQKMTEAGVTRTPREIKTKVANLTSDYRKERAKLDIGMVADESELWRFWEAVHDVIGNLDNHVHHPSTPPSSPSAPAQHLRPPKIEENGEGGGIKREAEDEEEDDEASGGAQFPGVEVILSTPPNHHTQNSMDHFHEHHPVKRKRGRPKLKRPGPGRPPSTPRGLALAAASECSIQSAKLLKQVLQEQKRIKAQLHRIEDQLVFLLGEQLDVQRKSLGMEERIAGAIDGLSRALANTQAEGGGGGAGGGDGAATAGGAGGSGATTTSNGHP